MGWCRSYRYLLHRHPIWFHSDIHRKCFECECDHTHDRWYIPSDVYGWCRIRFHFAINVLIGSGGSFQDQTDNNRIYCRPDTLFTFLDGGLFTGLDTIVFTYTGTSPSVGVGNSFTFGSSFSGPFTFGILLDGSIQNYNSIMCVVRSSGSFTNGFSCSVVSHQLSTFVIPSVVVISTYQQVSPSRQHLSTAN